MSSGTVSNQTTNYPSESVPDANAVWQQARALLQTKLSPAVYSTWIVTNPLTNLTTTNSGDHDLIATITAPTAFHAVNLKKNLHGELCDSLETVLNKRVAIEYVVVKSPQPSGWQSPLDRGEEDKKTTTNIGESSYDHADHPTNGFDHPQNSKGFSSWSKHPSQDQVSPRVESLFSPANLQQSELVALRSRQTKSGLNPPFTFASYAVSGSNEMAHAAAVAVSQNPGSSYNPLFLYGDVGVGKTHLMHAIGNNVLADRPNAVVLYCTGEDFTNDIVQAIQAKKASSFKNKYRGVDVLLIDDVQFIAGKQTVQEEFFHTFNSLVKQQSQVVLTSDRPPEEIALLENRLRSRFEAGLMVDIGEPTFELRVAILLLKSQAAGLPLNLDQAKLVAQQVDSPRRLEGFISRLRSEIELKKQPFSDDLIKQLITKESRQAQTKLLVPPQEIIRQTAGYYQLKPMALRGMRREKHYVKARHVAMFILKEDACLSLTEVGRWFSNRDHTSVLHAVRKITADLMVDAVLQKDIVSIRAMLTKK